MTVEKNEIPLESIDKLFIAVLVSWCSIVAGLGYLNVFTHVPIRALPLLIASGIFIPIIVYIKSKGLRTYINSISLKHLTLFHIWRIPAGFTFLWYGNLNLLPDVFVQNAGYGDLIIGFLVPIVLLLPETNTKYLVFHIFGMIDFVVAVGTGLALSLLGMPEMESIVTFPIVLIPLFGVCVTGSLSIMTLDRLLRNYRNYTTMTTRA